MSYVPGAAYKFYASGATPKTVTNTTTRTSLLPTPITASMNVLRAPNWWSARRRVNVQGTGYISVPAGAQPTFAVVVNNVVVATSPAPASGLFTAFTTQGFDFDVDIICETVGTTGTFFAGGNISINGSILQVFTTAAVSVDTTISGQPDFMIQWDAATTSRTATCYMAEAETAA